MRLNSKQKEHIAKICHSIGIGAVLPLILNKMLWVAEHIVLAIVFVLCAIIAEIIAVAVLKSAGDSNE